MVSKLVSARTRVFLRAWLASALLLGVAAIAQSPLALAPALAQDKAQDVPPEMAAAATQRTAADQCQALLKQWSLARSTAKAELADCNLHRFHEACRQIAQARTQIMAPASPCRKVKDAEDVEDALQLPELNCTVVQVPPSCAEK